MDDVTPERWVPVPGHYGYEISDHGQARSYRRRGTKDLLDDEPHALKPGDNGTGYLKVHFGKRGGSAYIHQLVAAAFIGECPPGQEVRHKDGNRANNHWTNLCFGTRSDNNYDKREHGTAVNQNTDKTICDNGHTYTDATTYVYPNGERCCKICRAASQRRSRRAKRERGKLAA